MSGNPLDWATQTVNEANAQMAKAWNADLGRQNEPMLYAFQAVVNSLSGIVEQIAYTNILLEQDGGSTDA